MNYVNYSKLLMTRTKTTSQCEHAVSPEIKWIIMSDDLNYESMYSDQCLNGFRTPLPSIMTFVIT